LIVYSCKTQEFKSQNSNFWGLFYMIFAIVILILLLKCKQIIFKILCEFVRNEFDKTGLVVKKNIEYQKGFDYEFQVIENSDKANFIISCNYETMEMKFRFRCYYISHTPKKKIWIKPVSALNNSIKISIFLYSSGPRIVNYVINKEKRISSNYT